MASYKTNYWEPGVEWNSVIFPVTVDKLKKDYKFQSCAIKKPQFYFENHIETGEVAFDLHF
jgi:hypothetical protein